MFNTRGNNGVLVTTAQMSSHIRQTCREMTLNQIEAMLSGIVIPSFDGASIMPDKSREGNCYTAFPIFNGAGPTLDQTTQYIREVRSRFDQTSYFKAEVKLHDNTLEDESPRYVVLIKIL